SGHPGATADALHTLARAGRAVLVGMGDAVSLPLTHIQSREIEVTGTFRYANTWPTAIALAASGRVDVDSLVTGHFPVAESAAARLASERDPLALNAVIKPKN